jgi:pimeloyl-ACP methyl ester carboxylesterase
MQAEDVGTDGDPIDDPHNPAKLVPLTVNVTNGRLIGTAYVPSGGGPHPAVLFLHGLPGYERNFDLAQACRRAGWTAITFHYRGAWGSEGTFSFRNVLEDGEAVLSYLRSQTAVDSCRIDSERVAVVGHSMGGWLALMLAAQHNVISAVSIAGYNVGAVGAEVRDDPQALARLVEVFGPALPPLAGVQTIALFEEAAANADDFDVRHKAPDLARLPVLLLAATRDPAVPHATHHRPLVEAIRRAGSATMTDLIVETDHAFSNKRLWLASRIIEDIGMSLIGH